MTLALVIVFFFVLIWYTLKLKHSFCYNKLKDTSILVILHHLLVLIVVQRKIFSKQCCSETFETCFYIRCFSALAFLAVSETCGLIYVPSTVCF